MLEKILSISITMKQFATAGVATAMLAAASRLTVDRSAKFSVPVCVRISIVFEPRVTVSGASVDHITLRIVAPEIISELVLFDVRLETLLFPTTTIAPVLPVA